jgi:hypothetical protein
VTTYVTLHEFIGPAVLYALLQSPELHVGLGSSGNGRKNRPTVSKRVKEAFIACVKKSRVGNFRISGTRGKRET